jgi:hypothetical protein
MKDSKDDLLNLIRKGREKSSILVKQANKIGEYGQYVNDLADASERAIGCVSSSNFNYKPKIASWGYLNKQLELISQDIEHVAISVGSSSASNATSFMLDVVDPDYLTQFVTPGQEAEARSAAINLGNVIDRLTEKSKALELLYEFGLSTAAPGKKCPAELLEVACAAFENPVTQGSSASTSLLPMRDCINSTVAALLKRRPKQNPAKSKRDKILSIAEQTARFGITDWAVESIADRYKKLCVELSSSKQEDVPREEWMVILRRAMVLLIEFLQSIDQTKMK